MFVWLLWRLIYILLEHVQEYLKSVENSDNANVNEK